ncbi:protein of unknown function (DUF3328) domain containing protein [Hyaloscypha variabilis]
MGIFSEWRNKRFWTPIPSNHGDLDVENKLLGRDDTEASSRRTSDVSEEIRLLWTGKGFGISKTWLILTVFNAVILSVSVILNKSNFLDFTRSCIRETSAYSPIIESSQALPFHKVRLNGTLWPTEGLSWSRREPGDPIAEAIWDSFEDMHTFPITRKQVLALGKDPETAARYDDEYWGMGDDAYIAALDSQHKMHCLNELRKTAFADYGEKNPNKKKMRELDWIHLRHCTDILTQDMLCHADADLITYNWRDTQPHLYPDFSIIRKCRNFDDLIAFRDERRVDMSKYEAMEKPKDIMELPMEAGYYSMV